ncbi:MAG TPA: HNH endonuclease [Herpetosiphonaceae bacterium]
MSRPYISREQRLAVGDRAQGCCEYCRSQERFAMQSFSIEHIAPYERGGAHDLDNFAFSCQGCNNHKYTKTEGRDPESDPKAPMVPLFHPRQNRWHDHFAWSEDFTIIAGLTPTGRATVEALRLNRPGLVNLRRLLVDAGEHPPPDPE